MFLQLHEATFLCRQTPEQLTTNHYGGKLMNSAVEAIADYHDSTSMQRLFLSFGLLGKRVPL